MQFVRRHLRKGTSVWLMCHALTFTALVPRDCCTAHAHAAGPASSHTSHATASGEAPCHEAAASGDGAYCDMAAEDGVSCPMHAPGAAPAECRMTGTCHAPEAALAAVLLQAGVLVATTHHEPAVASRAASPPPDVSAHSLAVPPDAPPPRL